MDFLRWSIDKPVGVTVGVILLVMFGLIGLTAIPVQLTPTVDRPIITVTTEWPGRSPEEIVDEIVKEQEEELKNVSGLKRMQATTTQGTATVELEFYIDTVVSRALQEVSDNLRQVAEYPEEVEEPRVTVADGASENAIAWIIIDVDPEHIDAYPDFDVASLYDSLDKEVKPFVERIEGVAEVNIFGGREREVHVEVDAEALALRGLNLVDVIAALRAENRTISAGTIAEGKRDYRVRVVGRYDQLSQVENTVIAARDGDTVLVKDVATVRFDLEKRRGFVRTFGHPSLAMNVIRQSGANVVDVMKELRSRLDTVRSDILPLLAPAEFEGLGEHLRIRQVYDETTYIDSAIGLVTQNLFIGGAIAGVVLMVFLRSFVSTAIIAVAIPISVIGTFLVMLAMGRTLNVISLAGLAFAVGMVVDNAIVVLENIYRLRQNGEPAMRAAYKGSKEVYGAIIASTLTTAAVFVPVLTIQEEAGQLFRDIALAIVGAVILSMLVSLTVIPSAAARLLRVAKTKAAPTEAEKKRGIVGRFAEWLYWVQTGWRGWTLRPAVVIGMTVASVGGAILLVPPLDYLPAGNRNLVFGGLLTPPGLSVDEQEDIAEQIEAVVTPYANATADPESYMKLPKIMRFDPDTMAPLPQDEWFDPVPMDNFFIGAFGGGMFVGGTSELPQIVRPLGNLLSGAINPIPDTFGGASQSSLFGRGVGGGNTVDVEIAGETLPKVLEAARMMYTLAGQRYGFGPNGVQASPSNFNLEQQEWQLRLSDRGRELGLSTEMVGTAVRGLFDGAFAGDFELNDENIDIVVKPSGGRLANIQDVLGVPIATPAGPVVPIDTLVDLVPALAPQDIVRIEELPAVRLLVQPREGQTVEELENDLREYVIQPAREAGLIDRTMRIDLEGTAAQLDEVRAALFGASTSAEEAGMIRVVMWSFTAMVFVGGGIAAVVAGIRASRRRCSKTGYGVFGVLVLSLAIGVPLAMLGWSPELILARMVWALLVTYLLMCALFESFIYPFVIMFSVPLAVVGGFGGLAIVHAWSLTDPTKAPQNLDVLTMLGFVILIGVVVNNAILLVAQAQNYMRGIGESEDDKVEALPPLRAISESVRTRVRPIFMSVLTSVGGMLPLVLFPGAGSEMYRGLGSVVVGGLLVSTIFTLLLVPLLFGLTVEAVEGVKIAFSTPESECERTPRPKKRKQAAEPAVDDDDAAPAGAEPA